jgi:hypothetical protein
MNRDGRSNILRIALLGTSISQVRNAFVRSRMKDIRTSQSVGYN